MYSVKINIANSVYDKVIFLLQHLPSVKIVENKKVKDKSQKEQLKELEKSTEQIKNILDIEKEEVKELLYELKKRG